jgi:hypothetical protein
MRVDYLLGMLQNLPPDAELKLLGPNGVEDEVNVYTLDDGPDGRCSFEELCEDPCAFGVGDGIAAVLVVNAVGTPGCCAGGGGAVKTGKPAWLNLTVSDRDGVVGKFLQVRIDSRGWEPNEFDQADAASGITNMLSCADLQRDTDNITEREYWAVHSILTELHEVLSFGLPEASNDTVATVLGDSMYREVLYEALDALDIRPPQPSEDEG